MTQAYIIPGAYTKPARTPEVREVNAIVERVVMNRAEYGTIKLALAAAADILCLGMRRTRGHYHNEIAHVSTEMLADVRTAYAGHLRQRQSDLADAIEGNRLWLAEYERAGV